MFDLWLPRLPLSFRGYYSSILSVMSLPVHFDINVRLCIPLPALPLHVFCCIILFLQCSISSKSSFNCYIAEHGSHRAQHNIRWVKAFTCLSMQQNLNGVNNNLMEEKDSINYYAMVDRLLDIINWMRKRKANQTM